MVELVLISPLLVLVVGGIVQLALALNYWMDLQRIANQGARWAVVARYPLPDGTSCTGSCSPSLQEVLVAQAQAEKLDPTVSICFPNSGDRTPAVGEPVRVRLQSHFSLIPLLGIAPLNLAGDAEMRIEQPPGSVYDATGEC
jgi:hypothetical protein